MVATKSNMLKLGTVAPDFSLPNTNPGFPAPQVSLSEFSGSEGIVIAFICNHCPFVANIKVAFTEFADEYQSKGITTIAISANDVSTYPADSPAMMAKDAVRFGYSFPYLYDESQSVAKAYEAACTPDFYFFDSQQTLVYRGQFDNSRPSNGITPTGSDLRKAAEALLAGIQISQNQRPSFGCNIKWKNIS